MAFSLRHVTKYKRIATDNGEWQRLAILDDISIEACGSDIHVILGPSGSGKTTLLRMLNRLESPDSGQILYHGEDIRTIPPEMLRRQVGMVFQVPALFSGTVADNICYGPALQKRKLSSREIKDLLAQVDLAAVEVNRDVNQLSVGQQQRVAFARALANRPDVLLLDEPTSALDPSSASRLLELIRYIHVEQEIGIIMVTHVLEHARQLANSVCLLVQGKIVEHQDASTFFQQPKTQKGQNFLNGTL